MREGRGFGLIVRLGKGSRCFIDSECDDRSAGGFCSSCSSRHRRRERRRRRPSSNAVSPETISKARSSLERALELTDLPDRRRVIEAALLKLEG